MLDQIFAVKHIYNSRLRILNIVFKPFFKVNLIMEMDTRKGQGARTRRRTRRHGKDKE